MKRGSWVAGNTGRIYTMIFQGKQQLLLLNEL